MTQLSDDTDRRLTASAGTDSLVQFHCDSALLTKPSPSSTARISWTFTPPDPSPPNDSSSLNGSSNAAHFTWSSSKCRLSGLISACSGEASKKYEGLRTTN